MISIGAIHLANLSAYPSEEEVLLATEIPCRIEYVRQRNNKTEIGIRVDEVELWSLDLAIKAKCHEYLKQKEALKRPSEINIKPILIWRAKSSQENLGLLNKIQKQFCVQVFHEPDSEQALKLVSQFGGSNSIHVASDRSNGGKEFALACQNAGIVTPILIFCGFQGQWQDLAGVSITTSPNEFMTFIAKFAKSRST
jgi:hypothetical protein